MVSAAMIEQTATSAATKNGLARNEVCSTDEKTALDAATARYIERNPTSKRLHEEAVASLPGGNTRTLLYTAPFPLSMKCGKVHKVYDEDGHDQQHTYLQTSIFCDFVGELTAGLFGHSNPIIRDTLVSTIDNIGLNLGATTTQESTYAALLCSRFNLERVRFCNSGTEANLHALAGARRFTGRRKVLVFDGAYHGAVLSFGDGPAPNNVDLDDWVVARYNDVESARAAIEGERTESLAAVLVEGMQGSGGCIPGSKEFLLAVQESAKKVGAVFILDEVMTSRLAPGGIQSTHNLSPDLTTFGKWLGGGLAFGAFGGREAIMSVYDPRLTHSLAHSGTFNNNTLAMHVGHAGLSRVYTPDVCRAFTAQGDAFRERLRVVSQGTTMTFTGCGSLLAMHVTKSGRRDLERKRDEEEEWGLKDLFWLEMMEEGFWITRRGSISLILGTPEEELERFVRCVEGFLERHKGLFGVSK